MRAEAERAIYEESEKAAAAQDKARLAHEARLEAVSAACCLITVVLSANLS